MNREGTAPRRIAFRVEYDGTHYHGWQAQPSGCPTIQGTLESVFSDFLGHACSIQGASRTDAGVHALDQLAATTISHPIEPAGLMKAINQRLPQDIAIRSPQLVDATFNPRFGNRHKTYVYTIYKDHHRRPLIHRFAWRVPWTLNHQTMQAAADDCIGTHDFRSFAAADGSHRTTDRTIHSFAIDSLADGETRITVQGTAFMKNMVRILVGTLVDIGRGRLSREDMEAIKAAKNRQMAGPTAPPQGLRLQRILANFEADSSRIKDSAMHQRA